MVRKPSLFLAAAALILVAARTSPSKASPEPPAAAPGLRLNDLE